MSMLQKIKTGCEGKTILWVQFDGYDELIITFTDGTSMTIYELSQSGQLAWEKT
jgi:hypothetical protein